MGFQNKWEEINTQGERTAKQEAPHLKENVGPEPEQLEYTERWIAEHPAPAYCVYTHMQGWSGVR